jgi:hypothetical protein
VSVAVAQPKVDVEEASRRDFSLKPKEAADTIIALAISRRDSFRGRAAGAKNMPNQSSEEYNQSSETLVTRPSANHGLQ